MPDPLAPTPPISCRDRSAAARQAARQGKAQRERRIVDWLNRGLSIAEIAAREKITERGMRKFVRVLLARRAPETPAEFIAVQVSRLNEALLASYDATSGENLEAVDRVVKIVRELDRYLGFDGADGVARRKPSGLAPPGPARASGAERADGTKRRYKPLKPFDSGAEMAPPRRHADRRSVSPLDAAPSSVQA